jgi:hypothetical protein
MPVFVRFSISWQRKDTATRTTWFHMCDRETREQALAVLAFHRQGIDTYSGDFVRYRIQEQEVHIRKEEIVE